MADKIHPISPYSTRLCVSGMYLINQAACPDSISKRPLGPVLSICEPSLAHLLKADVKCGCVALTLLCQGKRQPVSTVFEDEIILVERSAAAAA